MQIFIDSANIEEIRNANILLPIDGVTTNPSLMAKISGTAEDILHKICETIGGSVSASTIAEDYKTIMAEAAVLTKIADNICVKLPMNYDGLRACRELSLSGHKTNMTLCFSLPQAILAAKANATYVSPFIGRLDDVGQNGLNLIADIRQAYDFYGFKTKILAASIRNLDHISGAVLRGANIITIPPQLLRDMVRHPLTDKGLSGFAVDQAKKK